MKHSGVLKGARSFNKEEIKMLRRYHAGIQLSLKVIAPDFVVSVGYFAFKSVGFGLNYWAELPLSG